MVCFWWTKVLQKLWILFSDEAHPTCVHQLWANADVDAADHDDHAELGAYHFQLQVERY